LGLLATEKCPPLLLGHGKVENNVSTFYFRIGSRAVLGISKTCELYLK
jgi:hypothetical protein